MDSTLVSEADDPGSIPGEATRNKVSNHADFTFSPNIIPVFNPNPFNHEWHVKARFLWP
jgi:hypothetical protein